MLVEMYAIMQCKYAVMMGKKKSSAYHSHLLYIHHLQTTQHSRTIDTVSAYCSPVTPTLGGLKNRTNKVSASVDRPL